MSAPAAELESVSKRYGKIAALDGVSLTLEPGESVVLIGHNGAGKTTLFKLMLGLARPSGGRVRVLGAPPRGAEGLAARKRVGFMPERLALYDDMTGLATLRFYARLKGAAAASAGAALERMGLGAAADRRIGTWSRGMRQRLGLAQALLGAPRLLLLDEPADGLDPSARPAFLDAVEAMTDGGAAALLSSHALAEIESPRFSRIAILRNGRLAACGALDELRAGAGLPSHIRLRTAPGRAAAIADRFPARAVLRARNDAVELAAAPGELMPLARRAAALGDAVQDMEIRPPALEAVHAHYAKDRPCRPVIPVPPAPPPAPGAPAPSPASSSAPMKAPAPPENTPPAPAP